MKKIFFVLIVSFLLSSPCLAGEWNLTGSLNQGREEFCSVKLDDGRILVAGGYNSGPLSSCEIYTPNTGEWSTTDSMNYAVANFSLTKLSDGKILAIYGIFSEIFNPATETWGDSTMLNFTRGFYHGAILLENGKVLVVGGDYQNNYQGCEIYDPNTNEWILTGFCIYQKVDHTLELLPDGRVMAIGGGNSSYEHCEIYDPDTEIWTEIDELNEQRIRHTSHLLPNGSIIAIAGDHGNHYNNSCEIYDFATREWTFADSLEIGRTGHCSESLLNNKILVMGGQGETGSGSGYSCEIYNPTTNEWQTTTSPYYPYSNFATEILFDEKVLAIYSWCEIYTWNYQPVVSQPQGPSQGTIGEILTFSITATDPDADSIAVRIDWGDDEISNWTNLQPSGYTFELSHSWTEPGQYEVRSQTADQWYFQNPLTHNSISEWSEPLIVTIFGIPEISISVDSLNFGTVYIGLDSLLTLSVSNLGNGTLTADACTNTSEFTVYPANFNLEPTETIDIEITFAPIYEGVITDTLVISSNDPENPEVQVELIGKGETLVDANENISEIFIKSIKAYPNPFNTEITISFSSTSLQVRPARSEIQIFNIKGQIVKSWSLLPTTTQVVWNGRDANGKPVASGIYFYKMDAGLYRHTRKIILMK